MEQRIQIIEHLVLVPGISWAVSGTHQIALTVTGIRTGGTQ